MDIWRGPVTPMGEMRDWRDGVRRKGTGRLVSSSPTSNAKVVKGPVLPKFRKKFLHEASLEDRNDTVYWEIFAGPNFPENPVSPPEKFFAALIFAFSASASY